MVKKRKLENESVAIEKRKKKPIRSVSSIEHTGILRGDHDDVGCGDKPTDYDDPDVCYQLAMNNPRA